MPPLRRGSAKRPELSIRAHKVRLVLSKSFGISATVFAFLFLGVGVSRSVHLSCKALRTVNFVQESEALVGFCKALGGNGTAWKMIHVLKLSVWYSINV